MEFTHKIFTYNLESENLHILGGFLISQDAIDFLFEKRKYYTEETLLIYVGNYNIEIHKGTFDE